MPANIKKIVKQGFSEDVIATVTDSGGNTIDLQPYDGIRFIMVNDQGSVIVNDTAGFIDKPTWKIKYTLSTTHTQNTGIYKAYFQLTVGGVPRKSAPNDHFTVEIIDNLL